MYVTPLPSYYCTASCFDYFSKYSLLEMSVRFLHVACVLALLSTARAPPDLPACLSVFALKFQIRGWTVDSTVVVGRLHAYLYQVPDRSA